MPWLTFARSLFVAKDVIELIGLVTETFPNTMFQVQILSAQARDHELLCHLAGRMRKFRVRILPGDYVKVELTPYDLQKGRITYRFRGEYDIPIDSEGNPREVSRPDEDEQTTK